MKKRIQRAAVAAIIGTLTLMTSCEQSDDSNMNSWDGHGKMDSQAKPMPKRDDYQMQNREMQKHSGSHGKGKSYYERGDSQRHY